MTNVRIRDINGKPFSSNIASCWRKVLNKIYLRNDEYSVGIGYRDEFENYFHFTFPVDEFKILLAELNKINKCS